MPVHSQYRRDTICVRESSWFRSAYGKLPGSTCRTSSPCRTRHCVRRCRRIFFSCMHVVTPTSSGAQAVTWVVAWITSQLHFFTFLRNWFNIIYHGRLSCLRPKFITSLTSGAKIKSHSKSTPLHFERKMSSIGPFLERPIEPAQRDFCESNKVL